MSTIPSPTEVEIGDHVITPSGNVHWVVEHIFSKIDPLGVLLTSGQTGRKRYEDFGNLVMFKKGDGSSPQF